MSGIIDITVGRIKEAAGALVNNEELRSEGKADQVAGKAEKAVEDSVRKIKEDARDSIDEKRIADMNGKLDVVKGRIKEATGVLTNNEKLRNEGKANQAAGNAGKIVEETIQAIKDTAQKAIDKVKGSAE
jgi:uncharacterized protein YjbJ (UPF0337 family)